MVKQTSFIQLISRQLRNKAFIFHYYAVIFTIYPQSNIRSAKYSHL